MAFMAALPFITAGAGLLGNILGRGGQGAANERANQNQAIQTENNRATSIYGTQQGALANLLGQQERATMDRAQLGIAAPSARTKQSLLGSILQNAQPMNISAPSGIRMGNVSGGMSAALINDLARASGKELQTQAHDALVNKSDIPAMTDFVGRGMLAPPTMQGYQEAGRGESLMSGGGLLGSIIGGLGQLVQARNGTRVPGADPTLDGAF